MHPARCVRALLRCVQQVRARTTLHYSVVGVPRSIAALTHSSLLYANVNNIIELCVEYGEAWKRAYSGCGNHAGFTRCMAGINLRPALLVHCRHTCLPRLYSVSYYAPQ